MTMSTAAAPRSKVTRSTEDRSRSAWVGACRRKARDHAGKPTPAIGSVHSSPFRSGFWIATSADDYDEEPVIVNHAVDVTHVGNLELSDYDDATTWTWIGRGVLSDFAKRYALEFDGAAIPPIDCLPGD